MWIKEENETSTETKIKLVEADEVIDYLAQMTVGDELTETSRKQAEEMRKRTGK